MSGYTLLLYNYVRWCTRLEFYTTYFLRFLILEIISQMYFKICHEWLNTTVFRLVTNGSTPPTYFFRYFFPDVFWCPFENPH